MNTSDKSTPLGTITNILTKTIPNDKSCDENGALSPSLQNVTQLKNWITKMEKENKEKSNSAWKKPASIRCKATRIKRSNGRVHEIREKINERKLIPRSTNGVVRTPAPASRTVKIPVNKVQQMRQILLDFKNTQAKQSEMIHMSSKKRAKIEERLNRVQDIQKWLNEMEHQSRKATERNDASVPKTKELNLPLNRVNEMKNWLIEFEKQNKEHSKRFTGKTSSFGSRHFGADMPTNTQTQRSDVGSTEGDHLVDNVSNKAAYTPSKTVVAELAQLLVDFEKRNKEHYERSQRKSVRPDSLDLGNSDLKLKQLEEPEAEKEPEAETEDESTFDPFLICNIADSGDDIELETEEEKDDETETHEEIDRIKKESQGTDFVVLNTSMLDKDNNKVDTNTSMIPALNILEQSQWDDDYDDLMKVDINIEPVQSAESWENESFGYSNGNESQTPSAEEEEVGEETESTSTCEDQEISDGSLAPHNDSTLDENEETSIELTTNGGHSTEESLHNDELTERIEETDNEQLLGEAIDVLSTSHSGSRFSSSHLMNTSDTDIELNQIEKESRAYCHSSDKVERNNAYDNEVQSGVSRKGFGCVYKSLFRVFVPKKKSTDQTFDEERRVNLTLKVNKFQDNAKGNDEQSHVSHTHHEDAHEEAVGNLNDSGDNTELSFAAGYLPNNYTKSAKLEEPHDFARAMLLDRATNTFNPNCESPVSLASAFRRSMSPTSSSCAGSEISGVHLMINDNHANTNVSQHVGWLQGHFHSPKAAAQIKRRDNMY